MTNIKFGGTALQNVTFKSCKLLGANFSVCNPFLLSLCFRENILTLANFSGLPKQNTVFEKCTVMEADFTDSDLSNTDFSESILEGAIFQNTNLSKCNFSKAIRFTIDPTQNRMNHARFNKQHLLGLVRHLPIKLID